MDLYFLLGYLGSGKTTFVKNFLLRHGGKNAVLVNDFGDGDVDASLLRTTSAHIASIYNGSVFCSCKSDQFVDAMLELAKQDFDRVLVETSGLANPFSMLKVLDLINAKSVRSYHYCGAIAVVDVTNLEKVLYSCHAVRMQIAAADKILLNKSDVADDTTFKRVERLVREINPFAEIEKTVQSIPRDDSICIHEKTLPMLQEDLTIQKVKIVFHEVISQNTLLQACSEWAEICHRIKGAVAFSPDHTTLFEYVDAKPKYYGEGQRESYLVLLGSVPYSLRDAVNTIASKYFHNFSLC